MNDLVLRLQFDNNIKLIINVSQEDTTSSLIEKIKSLYALHYSKMIQLGSLKDDKGFEIINDIKLSSLFKNGDVLCVFVKEVGDFKSSSSNGLINYDYKEKEYRDILNPITNPPILNPITNPPILNPITNPPTLNPITNPPKNITLTSNPPKNTPKNITLTSLPKTKLPVKEEERSLTMNPITENVKEKNKTEENMKGENMKEKEIKKPRKRRPVVKPKENKNEDKKIKKEEDKIKNEVEDPFSVFEDLNDQNLSDQNLKNKKVIDTPSKIQPPVLNPIPKENKKDIKELKKKSKVDYNKVDD